MDNLSTTATLYDHYTGPANKIAAATQRINGQLSGLAKIPMASILGGLGIASLGIAAVTAGHGILGATVELEKYNAQLVTLTQSPAQGKKMMEFAEGFTKNAPFELKNVMAAMIRMKAFGLNPLGGELAKVGDLAAGFGVDITDAAQAVSAATMGMWRPMREYGINRKLVQEYADKHSLDSGMSKTGEIIDQAKAKLALFGLIQEKTIGGMARMMETIGGKWTVVREGFWQMAATIGESLKPAILSIEIWIIKTVNKIKEWFETELPKIKAKWAPIFAPLIVWTIGAYNVFTNAFAGMVSSVGKLIDKMGGLKQSLIILTSVSLGFFTLWVVSKWGVIMSWLRRMKMGIMAVVWWVKNELTLELAIAVLRNNWAGIAAAVAVTAGAYFGLSALLNQPSPDERAAADRRRQERGYTQRTEGMTPEERAAYDRSHPRAAAYNRQTHPRAAAYEEKTKNMTPAEKAAYAVSHPRGAEAYANWHATDEQRKASELNGLLDTNAVSPGAAAIVAQLTAMGADAGADAEEGNTNTATIAANTSAAESVLKQIGGGERTKRDTAFELFRLRTSPAIPTGAGYGTLSRGREGGAFAFRPNTSRPIQVTVNAGSGPLDSYIAGMLGAGIQSALQQLANQLTGGSTRAGANVG